MDDRLGNEVLKSNVRLRQEKNVFHHFSLKYGTIIKKRFPYLIVETENDGEIYIEGNMVELKNYIPLFNNLGYFTSMVTVVGSDWSKDFNLDIKRNQFC